MINNQTHPICIGSPVRRSGTTLLQRLLCSSPDCLIYGESVANDINILANLYASKEMLFKQTEEVRDEQYKNVLNGQLNDWIPDLTPKVANYLQYWKNTVEQFNNQFSQSSAERGRSLWGVKMPEWNPSGLVMLQRILPETKIIYLHRKLEDCVRSAKKTQMVVSIEELRRFCYTWKQFSDFASLHLTGEKVLHLQFEDLLENRETWINKIEEFTGAKSIDRNVLNVKVNTYNDDPKLIEQGGAFLNPAVLNEEELEIVKSFEEVGKGS